MYDGILLVILGLIFFHLYFILFYFALLYFILLYFRLTAMYASIQLHMHVV